MAGITHNCLHSCIHIYLWYIYICLCPICQVKKLPISSVNHIAKCLNIWHYACLVWLLEFYVLVKSKVIAGWAPICDSMHSWRLYSTVPLGDLDVSTMTWYSTQSHNPDTEPTSPCPILIVPSARLGSDKYNFLSHWFDSTRARTCEVQIPRSHNWTHSAIPSDLIHNFHLYWI